MHIDTESVESRDINTPVKLIDAFHDKSETYQSIWIPIWIDYLGFPYGINSKRRERGANRVYKYKKSVSEAVTSRVAQLVGL